MTMGKTALHRQRLAAARGPSAAAQHPAESLDLCLWPIRQIGKRALADLVAVTIALPQQDRRRRVAVRNALDVHGELESQGIQSVKHNHQITWVHKSHESSVMQILSTA